MYKCVHVWWNYFSTKYFFVIIQNLYHIHRVFLAQKKILIFKKFIEIKRVSKYAFFFFYREIIKVEIICIKIYTCIELICIRKIDIAILLFHKHK